MAYIAQGGEKEYYAASACEEVYVPPSGSLSLRGLGVAGVLLLSVPVLPHFACLDHLVDRNAQHENVTVHVRHGSCHAGSVQ